LRIRKDNPMKRIQVEVTTAAIKSEMAYTWYKVTKKMLGLELKGKPRDFRVGNVIGLRPSTNGKSTRMVLRDAINIVFSPTPTQVQYILSHVAPLMGTVNPEKVGLVPEVKPGVKERRIADELELIGFILQHGGPNSITDIKIKGNKMSFKYNGRPYWVV
jgi:hypothetical protein